MEDREVGDREMGRSGDKEQFQSSGCGVRNAKWQKHNNATLESWRSKCKTWSTPTEFRGTWGMMVRGKCGWI
jgi:hypothetical protein